MTRMLKDSSKEEECVTVVQQVSQKQITCNMGTEEGGTVHKRRKGMETNQSDSDRIDHDPHA